LPDSFHISRSLPHGHVAAVLGCLRNLQLDDILDPATARGLHCDTLHHSLGDMNYPDFRKRGFFVGSGVIEVVGAESGDAAQTVTLLAVEPGAPEPPNSPWCC
jgi:hypothetical protein